jgi:hypothetical protein
MSDAALSERRAAALEDSAPSDAMKPAASKTWRSRRADVSSPYPAAGMESPHTRKTWGRRRADVDSCGPAKPMEAAAGMETSDARKIWGGRRADVGSSGAVKVMETAAAKAAVESAAGKSGGDGRGAGVEIRRGGNAAGA